MQLSIVMKYVFPLLALSRESPFSVTFVLLHFVS